MIFKALLFLLLLLPFGPALNPTEGIDLASVRIFILAIFLFWLAEGLRKREIFLKIDIRTALVASFLFLASFSIFFARNTDFSARKLLFLFSIFPLYFVSRSLIDSRKKMEKTAAFLVLGGAIAAILGIFQFFLQFFWGLENVYDFWIKSVSPLFLGNNLAAAVRENPSWLVSVSGRNYLRSTSVFPDPHMLSFYLGMLVPLSLGMFLKNKRCAYLAAFFLLLLADLLTFSRGGYIGLLAGGISLLFFFWKNISSKKKLAAAALGFFLISALFFPGPVSERFSSSFNLQEGSNQGRLAMWKKAWEVSLENPLFGVGLGNYPLEVKPSADYRDPIYAHNTYLDISSETGIPAALTFAGIIFISILGGLKKSKKNPVFLGVLLGLVVFAAHSFFETGIYSPAVLGLFLVMISFDYEENA